MTSTALPTSLVVVRALPGYEPDTDEQSPRGHRPGRGLPPPDAATDTAVQPGRTPIGPMARARVHTTLRLILEVLDGRRPLGHLAGAVAEPVLGYIAAMSNLHRAGRPRGEAAGSAGLRSTRLAQPRDGAVEVSAVWQLGGRVRALAARFEELEANGPPSWRCVFLRLG